MKEELIEMGGVVVDKQPNAFFKVQINDTDHMVLATISGRMRRNRIRILMGDRVDIELSPYDLTKRPNHIPSQVEIVSTVRIVGGLIFTANAALLRLEIS